MISIESLLPGQQAKLLAFGNTGARYRQRLLAMGITRGAVIEVIRIAPLGCPVQVKVRGISLSLRLEEARELVWERM